ncbi:MAG: metallopeptidase TldD-related protein [Phormidesmis sp.]
MTLLSSHSDIGPSEDVNDSTGDRPSSQYETVFNRLIKAISTSLAKTSPSDANYDFTVSLAGEDSQFTRFNSAKVRQSGQVCDGQLRLTLMSAERTTAANIPFIGSFDTDWAFTTKALEQLRADLIHLPADPYMVLPKAFQQGNSREVRSGKLLPPGKVAETVIEAVRSLDFSGLYAGGLSYRAYGDSAGNRHWFETPSFTLDYSLFGTSTQKSDRRSDKRADKSSDSQAVKGILAGHTWSTADYLSNVASAQKQLALLARPAKAIAKGAYRTYLAPAAVGDIIDTLIWGGGLGEAALRQGNSAFNPLEKGEVALSEQFSLSEDFQRVSMPRFNTNGAIAPTYLPIIQNGQWASSLVNARSAKEYQKASNAANASESMRAPVVAVGSLKAEDILARLETGLYISNLHYLNWSDLTAGRITGMTRYACFWVEEGEIVAPIENLRFDDNLYRFLGEGLIALTDRQTFLPAVDTYERRSLGGMWVPGMLIEQFRYTL